ncbi:MAG: type II toxin-antitoxin system VapC family toxin [Stagnimonas sp.]|nr:type II toxin-antitoxin system VapC family toxin [Stagnimonas sp.]
MLDTQSLIWLLMKPSQIGKKALRHIERARADSTLCVSALTFWEAGQVFDKAGQAIHVSMAEWRLAVLNSGIEEVPLNGLMALRAEELLGAHPDPFDRFILATAEARKASLMTSDHVLLKWRGSIRCYNVHE